ncbi:MAG: hypothetical protein P9L99_07250 [Candidatus Lernaella stagnicola]|nr:hypothetical protein [Candidatus Lernaella stagnicola]
MSTGRRLLLILLAVLPFLLASLGARVFTQWNVIEKNPIPFDGRKLKAVYQAGGEQQQLECEGHICKLIGPLTVPFEVDRNGTAITHEGKLAYTPFWLPFSNPMLSLSTSNPHFTILDTAGLLGSAGTEYEARQEESFILMDDVLQSQASSRFGIFRMQDGLRAATAIYDGTCGMLFRLQIKQPDKPDLRLLKTSFPISRNRHWLLILNPLFAALLLLILFQRDKRRDAESHSLVKIVGLGILCLATDTLLDIWYPFLFGSYLPVIWHAALLIPLLMLGRRAAIPAVAEIVMALAFWIVNKGPALPFMYIPGATISFFVMLGMLKGPPPRREPIIHERTWTPDDQSDSDESAR